MKDRDTDKEVQATGRVWSTYLLAIYFPDFFVCGLHSVEAQFYLKLKAKQYEAILLKSEMAHFIRKLGDFSLRGSVSLFDQETGVSGGKAEQAGRVMQTM